MLITDLFHKKLSAATELPRLETIVAGIVLGLMVIAWTLDSFLNPMINSTDLNMVATMVTKDMDATLYARDNLFTNDELYRFYTPLYRWVIYQMWQLGGSFEAGLVWLVPPVLGLYLVGMFILLRQVTGNNWIALAFTLASAHYHNTMGAGVWGVGGSAEMMPRTLFTPIIPPLTLLFLNILKKPTWPKGAILGLVLGLLTNLHPVSGFHFLVLLSACLILVHGRSFSGWQTWLSIAFTTIIGALPVSWNYLQNSGQTVSEEVKFELFSRIVSERYPIFFFPATFKWPLLNLELTRPTLDLLIWLYVALVVLSFWVYGWGHHRWPGLVRWSWLVGGLITVAYAYLMVLFQTTWIFLMAELYIIYCFWRGYYSRLDGWLITLAALVVLYAFAGYYFLTLLWQTFEIWALTSLLIEYARAASFVYLPIYLLAGLAGVTLLKSIRHKFTLNKRAATSLWHTTEDENVGQVSNLSITGGGNGQDAILSYKSIFEGVQTSWAAFGAIVMLVLILFGPPASFLANYLPIPARNLLNPTNLVANPPSNQMDAELYNWVLQNTASDALFYGCFGSETMTYFRRKAQRSISHNWKDLAYAVHYQTTLLPAYNRFRELEVACKTFNSVVVAAHSIKADYILTSSAEAANYLHEACFINKRYAVFALNPNGCGSSQFSQK